MAAGQVEGEGYVCSVTLGVYSLLQRVHNQPPSKMGRTMEESGEQCTVVVALIINEPASDFVLVLEQFYAKTTVHCSPDSSTGRTNTTYTVLLLYSLWYKYVHDTKTNFASGISLKKRKNNTTLFSAKFANNRNTVFLTVFRNLVFFSESFDPQR
jgi:hypothetical protein